LMVDGNPVQTSANNGFVVQQNTNDAPDIIGGSSANGVAPGVVGATISGGGATNYIWAWGILDWIPIYSGVFVNTVGYFPGVSNNIASDFGVTQLKLDRCLCSFCL